MLTTMDSLPLLLTASEAGKVLRIGRSKVYELIRSGELKSIRIGKQIRVPRDAISELLRAG